MKLYRLESLPWASVDLDGVLTHAETLDGALVLQSKEELSDYQVERIGDSLKAAFPDRTILIVQAGLSLHQLVAD